MSRGQSQRPKSSLHPATSVMFKIGIYLINYFDFYVYFTLLYSEIRSKLTTEKKNNRIKENATLPFL